MIVGSRKPAVGSREQAEGGTLVTTEVRELEDGQWQVRVCVNGVEAERFDTVDTREEAMRIGQDFKAMLMQVPGSRLIEPMRRQ